MTTPVSGPGPFSQRTDKQPIRDIPNADYGEQSAFRGLQAAAPLAADNGQVQQAMGGPDFSNLIGLNEPSQQPNTPVTDGANSGPGADMSALGLGNPDDQQRALLTSYLPALEFLANQPGTSSAARNAVRRIKAEI